MENLRPKFLIYVGDIKLPTFSLLHYLHLTLVNIKARLLIYICFYASYNLQETLLNLRSKKEFTLDVFKSRKSEAYIFNLR